MDQIDEVLNTGLSKVMEGEEIGSDDETRLMLLSMLVIARSLKHLGENYVIYKELERSDPQ